MTETRTRSATVTRRGWAERPWLVTFWQNGGIAGWGRYRTAASAYTAFSRWQDGEAVTMGEWGR
jgi:hypothetical protein